MKNNSTKILVAVLSMVLLIGALFAMTVNADTETKPEIKSQNVKYTDKFCLMYAIPADTVKGDQVTLNVYDTVPSEAVDPIKSYTVKATTPAGKGEGKSGLDYEAYIITTDGVGAMDLDKVFYVQAIDGEENASDVKSYSVVEYLYTRLADVDGEANTEKQNNLYKSVIYFGTCAQQQFLKEDVLANTTLISDYCYVTTEGCTIDGKTSAVLPQNKAVTVSSKDGALSSCTLLTYDTYTTAGTETRTEITGNSVVVEDSARAVIIAGNSKVYKQGTEGFDDYSENDQPFKIAGASTFTTSNNCKLSIDSTNSRSNGMFTIVKDNVYGKDSNVLKVDYQASCGLHFGRRQGVDAATEAYNAIELSFDFRYDEENTYTGDIFKIDIPHGSQNVMYLTLGVDNGKLYFKDHRNSTSATNPSLYSTELDAFEWNSIRIVIKVDEGASYPSLYLYINNDTDTPDNIFKFNNSNTQITDLSTIGALALRRCASDITVGTKCYFDNIWSGNTNY